MFPRKLIVPSHSIVHAFFRCHNKKHFFESKDVKLYILLLWSKYKKLYNIEIYDFIIMDNHCHLLLKVEKSENLSNFMRTVNSQLARFINKLYGRDSQAIRERFKSPIVCSRKYFNQVMQYIWMNRYKINRLHPLSDNYCSAAWRNNPQCIYEITSSKPNINLLKGLLDSYESSGFEPGTSVKKFVNRMLNHAIANVYEFKKEFLENTHTIADKFIVMYRKEYLSSFRRERPIARKS